MNPRNRFESVEVVLEDQEKDRVRVGNPSTQFYDDATCRLISYNNSPDVPFDASLNPYRGCEHGCSYCYARPTHEYLGFSAGLDFESKIVIKRNAAELLRKELNSRSWKPQTLAMSGVTDCYQPIERHLKITRECLRVLAECRNPVSIITKNHLVTRDIDLLTELNVFRAVSVFVSITTLDTEMARKLEPRASSPLHRLSAVRKCARSGIPVGVMLAPVIPGLNEHEIIPILEAAADAGADFAGFTVLRLPFGVKDIFHEWLLKHVPTHADKVMSRLRNMRNGKVNHTAFGIRMKGSGIYAEHIGNVFKVAVQRAGLNRKEIRLSTKAFRRVADEEKQMSLFE